MCVYKYYFIFFKSILINKIDTFNAEGIYDIQISDAALSERGRFQRLSSALTNGKV